MPNEPPEILSRTEKAQGPPQRMTLAEARKRLARQQAQFVTLFKRGATEIEFYQPIKSDSQTPHERDEIYVIAAGSGEFEINQTVQPVETGEVLFVPAGAEHRFLHFTDDFATWVIWC